MIALACHRCTMRGMIFNMNAPRRTTSAVSVTTLLIDDDVAMAVTSASSTHAERSLTAAAVSESPAIGGVTRLSRTMRASTGNAVMLIAVAMNSENAGEAGAPDHVASGLAIESPIVNGSAMETKLMIIAERRVCFSIR